jgi:hypothetical protein
METFISQFTSPVGSVMKTKSDRLPGTSNKKVLCIMSFIWLFTKAFILSKLFLAHKKAN